MMIKSNNDDNDNNNDDDDDDDDDDGEKTGGGEVQQWAIVGGETRHKVGKLMSCQLSTSRDDGEDDDADDDDDDDGDDYDDDHGDEDVTDYENLDNVIGKICHKESWYVDHCSTWCADKTSTLY